MGKINHHDVIDATFAYFTLKVCLGKAFEVIFNSYQEFTIALADNVIDFSDVKKLITEHFINF
jgi:hypothetical protein